MYIKPHPIFYLLNIVKNINKNELLLHFITVINLIHFYAFKINDNFVKYDDRV